MNNIIHAVSTENYILAYKEIQHLKPFGTTRKLLPGINFLKAFLSYKTGHYKEAQVYFKRLLSQPIDIQDYINWYIAASYAKSGNCRNALKHLNTIAGDYTESVFFKSSIELSIRCLSKLKLYKNAIDLYAKYKTNPKFYRQLPDILTATAALYISMGDIRNGIKNYIKVYTQFPGSAYAASAFKSLSTITDVSKLNIDHYQIAKLLMMDRKYADALNEFNITINKALSEDNPSRLSMLYKDIGIVYYNMNRYNDAILTLKSSIYYNKKKHDYEEAIFWLGKSFLKIGQTDSAINTFIQLAYMKSNYAPMAMYKLYFIYKKKNDKKNEKYWLLNLADTNTPFSLTAYWDLGWSYYTSGNFKKALYYFNKTDHSAFSDQYEKTKADYWSARALLKEGKTEKATALFFDIANTIPLNYYTVMANMWIGVSILSYKKQIFNIPAAPHTEPAFTYHYSRYNLLKSLGINKEAMNELAALAGLNLSNREYLSLCREYYNNGDYFHSIYIAQTKLGGMLQTLTRDTLPAWLCRYPTGYFQIIESYAAQYKLNPSIVYAIILQESMYRSNAASGAGAIGIMQIMPSTGANIADNISITPFSTQVLFDPQVNIGMGIWYFKKLMTKYKGNYVLSLAAYNAGEKSVDNWLAATTVCNTDEFVENIPFPETRHYIKRIIANLATYTMIYGGNVSLEKHIYMEGRFLKGCLHKKRGSNLLF